MRSASHRTGAASACESSASAREAAAAASLALGPDGKRLSPEDEADALAARIADLKRRQALGQLTPEEEEELRRLEARMKELEKQVRSITHDTNPKVIEWQAGQLEDIGYGIKKLRIMVQVIDDEVSVDDDIVEKICEFEDHVQSCDIFAFNKV